MALTKQARYRNPDDFPTLQLFLLGESTPLRHQTTHNQDIDMLTSR